MDTLLEPTCSIIANNEASILKLRPGSEENRARYCDARKISDVIRDLDPGIRGHLKDFHSRTFQDNNDNGTIYEVIGDLISR